MSPPGPQPIFSDDEVLDAVASLSRKISQRWKAQRGPTISALTKHFACNKGTLYPHLKRLAQTGRITRAKHHPWEYVPQKDVKP